MRETVTLTRYEPVDMHGAADPKDAWLHDTLVGFGEDGAVASRYGTGTDRLATDRLGTSQLADSPNLEPRQWGIHRG
jgi:hypothetical protein